MFIIGCTIFADYGENLIERMSPVEDEIEKVYGNPSATTASMINTCESGRKVWDNELNTVYKLLMKKLPKEDQKLLRKDEGQWIKDRDKTAKEDGDEFSDEEMKQLVITFALYEETKNRTIELAELYDSF
jgi:uncharacterized protein YecT (DUF1311 family)